MMSVYMNTFMMVVAVLINYQLILTRVPVLCFPMMNNKSELFIPLLLISPAFLLNFVKSFHFLRPLILSSLLHLLFYYVLYSSYTGVDS